MFQYFRINDPYRLISVFVLTFTVRGIYFFLGYPMMDYELKWLLIGERLGDGFSMYRDAYDYTAPLSASVYWILDLIFGRSIVVHQILASFILAVNASLFNVILVRNRAYEENNFLPALFFVLMGAAIPDFNSLSPQLMSSFFIILTLNHVFRRINNQVEDDLFLHSGIYLGVAGLFYFPSVLFVLLFLLALILFSTAILRRIALYLYGFVVPFLIAIGYYYWKGSGTIFLSMLWASVSGETINYITWDGYWILMAFFSFWLVMGFYGAFFLSRQNNYEFRILQVMLLFAVTAIVILFIERELSVTQFIFFLPSLSYFLTYYALSIRKKFWKFIMPGFIVFGMLSSPFLFRHFFGDQLESLNSQRDPIPNAEKIMLLGDNLDIYQHHKIASPFIDPFLSKRQTYRLDYYDTAEDVYFSITKNYPDVIIDDWNLMNTYFRIFPDLKSKYRYTGDYYRKISN